MRYLPTAEDVANICDADRYATGDVVAREDVTVAELMEAGRVLDAA
ncbi:hypothetical protein GJV82_14390 [Cellulosimicrobium sp. BIT-GX5]|uniref:Uncharacterized protein n=1 Tax=Cellulosimicrobium composti TaxID=2672572 RepID=A0A6N7ZKT4_9MICO|nr:hypothetical protein [Cellulosimicrobium composti]MTG90125.1 hypothetical protein [Cellulosimicrobium composti]